MNAHSNTIMASGLFVEMLYDPQEKHQKLSVVSKASWKVEEK